MLATLKIEVAVDLEEMTLGRYLKVKELSLDTTLDVKQAGYLVLSVDTGLVTWMSKKEFKENGGSIQK